MPYKRVGIFFAILLFTFASSVTADELHVDNSLKTCNDLIGSPYCSINSAIGNAKSGDKIVVEPGLYNENVHAVGKSLKLQSSSGAKKTIIQGNGEIIVNIGPASTFSGFTVRNHKDVKGTAIVVNGKNNTVAYNVIEKIQQLNNGYGTGVGGEDANALIQGNIFRYNQCDDNPESAVVKFKHSTKSRIQNNIFVDNTCSAIDMSLQVSGLTVVVNNTIVKNRIGIHTDRRFNTSQQMYMNNILYKNSIGMLVSGKITTNNPAWDNNLVYDNGINYKGIENLAGKYGNLSAEPMFANMDRNDFRLRSDSPAVDRGTKLNAPDKDFLGNPRAIDGNGDSVISVDIGACEARPPIANAGSDLYGKAGQKITLNAGNSYDKDGIVQSYSWKLLRGSVKSFSGKETAKPRLVAANKSQDVLVQLTIHDDLGFTSRDIMKITVKPSISKSEKTKPYTSNKPILATKTKDVTRKTEPSHFVQKVQTLPNQSKMPVKISQDAATKAIAKISRQMNKPVNVISPFNTSAQVAKKTSSYASSESILPNPGNGEYDLSFSDRAPSTQIRADSKQKKKSAFNYPPEVDLGNDFAIYSGEVASINGTFSRDRDGRIVKYEWRQIGGPTVKITGENSDIAVFTAPDKMANLKFQLTVTDDSGEKTSDTINIKVNVNKTIRDQIIYSLGE